MEDQQSIIKALRVRIDGIAHYVSEVRAEAFLGTDGSSSPLYRTEDALFLGKAWLGKALGALGTPTPYPKDGERHSIDDIEPTADVAIDDKRMEGNHIEKVDYLRIKIGDIANELMKILDGDAGGKEDMFMMWSYKALCEARFGLGFELERVKKLYEGRV